MSIGKIFSNIGKSIKKTENIPKQYSDMQKQNKELLEHSMEPLSSEALANTTKGSFQAMQNLQELNKMLQQQLKSQQEQQE